MLIVRHVTGNGGQGVDCGLEREIVVAVDLYFGSDGGRGVTASVGIGDAPRDAQTAEELVRATDAALYRAKGLGGDRVQTWRETRALTSVRPGAI